MPARIVTVRRLGAYAERVLAARGNAERVAAVLTESTVPMAVLDDDRRIVDANEHHATAVGMSLDELRNLQIDDFTPPVLKADLEQGWRRMLETGVVTSNDFSQTGRDYLGITNCSVANALPGRHVILFVSADWPLHSAPPEDDIAGPAPTSPLTPRELEVLQLSANGYNHQDALRSHLPQARDHRPRRSRRQGDAPRAAQLGAAPWMLPHAV